MKSYKRLVILILVIFALVWCIADICVARINLANERPYMVEISRVAYQMSGDFANNSANEENAIINSKDDSDLSKYYEETKYIKNIVLCDSDEDMTANIHNEYCLKQIGDSIYRFEYDEHSSFVENILFPLNIVFLIVLILLISILIYFYVRIIRPFSELEDIPYQLSKGNLTLQIPEEKQKYFGKFIWGTNMLRENIESRRQNELNLHREKKLLLLSLTHDIKTPLSVIKLNTQALQRGLYKEEERRQEALRAILGKVDEIEGYVTEITRASKEDFLNLQVKEEEFYLSDVIDEITEYYTDKLTLKKTKFNVAEYNDCLLLGDENRLIEVIQNLIENAIKYGDGREINITFDEEEGCRLITVENSGEGLTSDELMKIFDSFFRGSNSGNQSGSGLGLYICRQLMTGMNGDIFVKQKENVFQMTVVVRMCG